MLSHCRRRIVHANCTEHPTATWPAQQVVDAFPDDAAPQFLLRDRDRIYDATVRRRVADLGIAEAVTSPMSPWQSPYVERLIGSIRRECLDHVIVFNDRHLRRLLRAYVIYYHRSRTHLGLAKDTPDPRPAGRPCGRIVATPKPVGCITATIGGPCSDRSPLRRSVQPTRGTSSRAPRQSRQRFSGEALKATN
jgi:putative transposase